MGGLGKVSRHAVADGELNEKNPSPIFQLPISLYEMSKQMKTTGRRNETNQTFSLSPSRSKSDADQPGWRFAWEQKKKSKLLRGMGESVKS